MKQLFLSLFLLCIIGQIHAQEPAAPLFRDPIYDGAADPVVIWNHAEQNWWMLYSARRANQMTPDVAFCYGTNIGVASSDDNGKSWVYRGELNLDFEKGKNTFWAPDIICHNGEYHMFVVYIKGVRIHWGGDARIHHYVSKNLWDWKHIGPVKLSSDKVIDASLIKMKNGKFRMWYKDDARNAIIQCAESDDLYNWTLAEKPTIEGTKQEGPKVFEFKGYYWMLTDEWHGMRIYRSSDLNNWEKQGLVLDTASKRNEDTPSGAHGDVVVVNNKAYIFYFTHPGRKVHFEGKMDADGCLSYSNRRSSIQVAELTFENGTLSCDRDKPFDFFLPDMEESFTNPLFPTGPDPWALCHDGNYYYMHTMQDRLVLWQTNDITNLKNSKNKTIWIPKDPSNSKNLWAPEIHFLNGKWYVYYAADDGNTDNHQLYVLENSNKDPFEGEFIMKGRISTDKNNNWAIDGSLFEHKGELYMVWSGWQTRRVSTETQCIYIAKMKNPWTLQSERILISKPELEWERHWINERGWTPPYTIYVNEGPQPLKSPKGKYIHIVYSASGCWTPYYALGMLTAKSDADLLNPKSWIKSPQSVFRQSPENGVYGTGHNSFFKSPDGTEDYILYHARDTETDPPGAGDTRSPRTQKIEWDNDDFPVMGVPLPASTKLPKPSGTKKQQ